MKNLLLVLLCMANNSISFAANITPSDDNFDCKLGLGTATEPFQEYTLEKKPYSGNIFIHFIETSNLKVEVIPQKDTDNIFVGMYATDLSKSLYIYAGFKKDGTLTVENDKLDSTDFLTCTKK